MPPPAPRAFASASFAANRAARDSAVRAAPDGVTSSHALNNRALSCGVRSSASAKRATGTTSIPTPTIIRFAAASRCRRGGGTGRRVVGQVAGERRHVRVQVGGGVVDCGRDLAETGRDELDLPLV